MQDPRTRTCLLHRSTIFMVLIWFCLGFGYISSFGIRAQGYVSFSLEHNGHRCEQVHDIHCKSDACPLLLLEKGLAEKQVAPKKRIKCFRDSTHEGFGSEAILSSWLINLQLRALKNFGCIPGNAVPLSCDCVFHIDVRAGPVIA